MNVYDFDKTIYPKDSSIQFYLYNLRNNPGLIRFWPAQFGAMLSHYVLKRIDKTEMKRIFYSYFKGVRNIEHKVETFWDVNEKHINPWYLAIKMEDDLIISASPEFLLKPICERLELDLIASRVDCRNGMTSGKNCHGEEKVVRFYQEYPMGEIDAFYSDSLSDSPLAKLAKESYLVKAESIIHWEIT